MGRFQRTEQLIGTKGLQRLQASCVAVFGIGGVGSYVFEALVRAGVGKLIIVDKDQVDITNINRQLVAYDSTVGTSKVETAKVRAKDINPEAEIITYELFYLEDTKNQVDLSEADYIVDAMDNVTAKLLLINEAKTRSIPILSSLGTGNKLDNTAFELTDISKTSVCPLAKVMRKELKARGIKDVRVVYSKEEPITKKRTPASISFVPATAGLLIAGEVVRTLLSLKGDE